MNALLGFFTPWIIYAIITFLYYFLPGKWMEGYVKHEKTNEILQYRLNGIYVLGICVVLWFLLGYWGWVSYDWLYTIRWYSLLGAITLGLLFSFLIVLLYPSTGKSLLADLFLGRLKNPQLKNGRFDTKIWLYLIGAIMLQINVLSFSAHHFLTYDTINPGIILCAALLSYFVWDYLSFEKVHLYTYDFIAERVGFKLGFGCLTFYPYFYLISLWATVDMQNPEIPMWLSITFAVLFFCGWSLARGANMQKYYFKNQPHKSFLGIKPEILQNGNQSILVNGFWGLSRHINYLGEILMGSAIALSVGYPGLVWVWLYPLYYVLLLFTRQWDDDKICSAKYGPLWDVYKNKVKYRIIPYIY